MSGYQRTAAEVMHAGCGWPVQSREHMILCVPRGRWPVKPDATDATDAVSPTPDVTRRGRARAVPR